MRLVLSKPFNLLAFNFIWLACVIGRDELNWLVLPLVAAYVAILSYADRLEPLQLLAPCAIGIGIDCVLTWFGIFAFETGVMILPLWLMTLWLAFSSTLSRSLAIIGRHWWLASLAGASAFPFNYAVGERLGAVTFTESYPLTLTLLSVIWAVSLPLLFHLAGVSPARTLPTTSGSAHRHT